MLWPCALVASALVGRGATQSGVDLDEPMLRGGPRTGTSAMLRFGCSQVVIERLDPCVSRTPQWR